MKLSPPLLLLPVALGVGFFIGKQGEKTPAAADTKVSQHSSTRETRAATRGPRNDPFGGPSFSLSSMDELRDLFKKQSYSVASARLTLSVSSLSAAEIPALMEMVQQDARDKPNDYQGRYALMNSLFERWAIVDPSASVEFIKNCKQRSFRLQAASHCFSAIAQVDSNRAIAELEKLPKGDLRSRAGMSVISTLGEHDPAAAMDLWEREPARGGFDTYYASEIFSNWAKTDPVAAAARLTSMPQSRVNSRSAMELASTWAQTDPEAALKWAKTLKGDWKSSAAIEAYKALSRDDPSAAWARLQGEPGHLRGKLIGGVLETVADEDPQKAATMLKSLDSKSEKRIAAGQLFDQLSWNDTRIGFDIMDQLGDSSIRKEQLGDLMQYTAWGSPQVLQDQVAKLTDREKIDTAGSVIRGLMDSDPDAAGKYFLALPESQRNTDSLGQMMQQFSRKDPKGAFEFAIALTNPQEQTAAVNGVFNNWSREDPEAAADGWKRLPAGQSRLEALDGIASSWAGSDPEAAKKWAEGLSGDERARDNPAAAGTQLSALIASPPDGMEKNLASSAGKLAGQWAGDDPASAANWASALPNGQSRDEGLKAVSQSWSQYDAIATAQWLGTLESGSSRDAAIQPLVNQVRKTDPGTAFSWAASISDENQRLNQLRQTLSSWRNSDLNAARAALDAAELSDKERETLSKEVK